jgi:SulP family sulfate permease
MGLNYQFDEISLLACKRELEGISLSSIRQDLISGMSVALLTLPQAMAYSMLAGLPLYCGLVASIFSAILTSLFCSSRHLIVGPSNAIAILMQYGTSEILFTYYRHLTGLEREIVSVQILTQLTLFIGLIQLVVALCKWGRLIQFVSHSVVVGYLAGTAIAVVINQLYGAFGIARSPDVQSLYERGAYFISHLSSVHIPTAIVGLSSLGLLILLRKINPRIPGALITFTIMAGTVYLFNISATSAPGFVAEAEDLEQIQKIMLVGDLDASFDIVPHFALPYFDTGIINQVITVAFAVALLSVMETISVAKSTAANSGQRLSVNQDILGLSIGNLLSAFISGVPVAGSSSRTALNFSNGAQTRLAGVFGGVFAAVILYCCGTLVQLVPIASLSALLLFTSVYIVNAKQFLVCHKATFADKFALWATLLACLFFNLDTAFYIGIFFSIFSYLNKAAIPLLSEYEVDDEGELHQVVESNGSQDPRSIRVIKVEGELFFGAADLFQSTLKAFAEDDTYTKVIILQLKNARDIDGTACLALQQLYEYLKGSGRQLIACGITQHVWEVLSDSGLVEQFGKENLIIFDERHPHYFMVKALSRARELVRLSNEPLGETIQVAPQPTLALAD